MFLSQLSPQQRDSAISELSSESFDILVIGGGVTGVGAALDAASRGHQLTGMHAYAQHAQRVGQHKANEHVNLCGLGLELM